MPLKELTFKEWDSNIKQQGLHLKFDNQLEGMLQSHTRKIPIVLQDLSDILRFPDAKRKEIYNNLVEGGEIEAIADGVYKFPTDVKARIDAELQHELGFYQTKWEGLCNICLLISKEQEFRKADKVERKPKGTTYYVDFDNGDDTNHDGTAPTATPNGVPYPGPWATLDKFTANGRSPGDKLIVRRGMTQVVTKDLIFTSDGTIVAPITIEADYDDVWGDFVDLSATATATLTFGSKTVTFSADVSGVLAAHDWIYVSGDNIRDYAYEVESVEIGTVTLYLPYKGGQAGSGKTTHNIKANPIWNIPAGDYEVKLDGDYFWKLQGVHFRGSDYNGIIEIDSCLSHEVKDCILEGNGSGDKGIGFSDDAAYARVKKTRFYNYAMGMRCLPATASAALFAEDCLFDGNNASSSEGSHFPYSGAIKYSDCEFKNHAIGDILSGHTLFGGATLRFRNCLFSSATEIDKHDTERMSQYLVEDHDQVVGDNRQFSYFSTAEGTPILQSEVTIVRPDGGASSIKVTPSDKLASIWEFSRLLLFEYPIYAVKDVEKTYTIYLKSSGTGNWTADPLVTELWIEAEYWGHASNNHRGILKSTGVCDFNGDDTTWHTLTVTVTPLQTGVLYLRGYYCKTKEAGKSNIFYVDTKLEIA